MIFLISMTIGHRYAVDIIYLPLIVLEGGGKLSHAMQKLMKSVRVFTITTILTKKYPCLMLRQLQFKGKKLPMGRVKHGLNCPPPPLIQLRRILPK